MKTRSICLKLRERRSRSEQQNWQNEQLNSGLCRSSQLHREGRAVNRKTVARYMQEMGLMAIFPGPNLSKRAQQAFSPIIEKSQKCRML
ncbi:transposase [Ktedonosporobacter rubrisoli]|uniref:Transposase n=1 Tax=Ktedonosporobacter rubrisoli TaxID=2509675 RepID=A0A4P6K464_KTERU|nr:transposase [Ktedonosporobacter rubrisoli]